VNKTDGCWLWTGSTAGRGYGHIRIDHRYEGAHRVSFALAVGPVPTDLFVCHHCDTPACVRPDHLFLGTASENAIDREKKQRHPYSKERFYPHITQADRASIRAARAAGMRLRDVAVRYGVTPHFVATLTPGLPRATPRPRRSLSDADISAIHHAFSTGSTQAALAVRFDVSRNRIARLLRDSRHKVGVPSLCIPHF